MSPDFDYATNRGSVVAQRLAADGSKLGAAIPVTDRTPSTGYFAGKVAVGPGGAFVVAWIAGLTTLPNNSYGYMIYAQRFGADGSKLGNEFEIVRDAGWFDLAGGQDGTFAACWIDGNKVVLQRFPATGDRTGPAVQANTTPLQSGSFTPGYPSIALRPDGSAVAVWMNSPARDSTNIFGQRVAVDGSKIGSELAITNVPPVPGYETGGTLQAVAAGPDSRFLVTWTQVEFVTNVEPWTIRGRFFEN
jgi:hypothetical protein